MKIKIFEANEEDQIYINYKGFNVTIPMLVWEFGEDLNLASIENVRIEGEDCFDKHFVIKKEDKDNFLNEIYFFLVDNNMDSVLQKRYRVNWEWLFYCIFIMTSWWMTYESGVGGVYLDGISQHRWTICNADRKMRKLLHWKKSYVIMKKLFITVL